MLSCYRLPENFNTCPSPVRNMHFEGPQNEITIYGKRRSKFIFLQKYSIILIILVIIIAPRQQGNHPMQLERHSSAFKKSNLSIYRYILTTKGDTRWDSVNQDLGSKFLLLFLVKWLFQNVSCVSSELRKSIACLIVLRTKHCSNWFLFEPFLCDMAVFFNL